MQYRTLKKPVVVLFIIELVILLYSIIISLSPAQSVFIPFDSFAEDNHWFYSNSETNPSIEVVQNGEASSTVSSYFSLKPGAYDVTVNYESILIPDDPVKDQSRLTGSILAC